jgi:hypothetical protein
MENMELTKDIRNRLTQRFERAQRIRGQQYVPVRHSPLDESHSTYCEKSSLQHLPPRTHTASHTTMDLVNRLRR